MNRSRYQDVPAARPGLAKLAARVVLGTALLAGATALPAQAQEPEVIFKKSTVWKMLTPDDKLVTYAHRRPRRRRRGLLLHGPRARRREGHARRCRGGFGHLAACRQVGPDPDQGEVRAGRRWCSASRARCSSRRCRSCAAATPSATSWSTWSIRTGSSRVRRRTRRPPCRSMPWGASASRPDARIPEDLIK